MYRKIEAIIQKYIKVIQYITSGGQKPTDLTNIPTSTLKLIEADNQNLFEISYKYGKLEIKLGNKVYKLSESDIDRALKKIELSSTEKQKLELLSKNQQIAVQKLFDKVSYKAYDLAVRKLEDPYISTAKIVSELRESTQDFTRDWHRIAITSSKNNQLKGQALGLTDKYGKNARVFKRPAHNCCKYCEKHYLEPGSRKPRVFKLEELIKNGSNYGRKAVDWLPVLGTMHPNCLCELMTLPEGFELNDDGEMVLIQD